MLAPSLGVASAPGGTLAKLPALGPKRASQSFFPLLLYDLLSTSNNSASRKSLASYLHQSDMLTSLNSLNSTTAIGRMSLSRCLWWRGAVLGVDLEPSGL